MPPDTLRAQPYGRRGGLYTLRADLYAPTGTLYGRSGTAKLAARPAYCHFGAVRPRLG